MTSTALDEGGEKAGSGSRRATSVLVVVNPKSGGGTASAACGVLQRHLSEAGVACSLHEPSHAEPLLNRIREAVNLGCDLVVAAGGDGTVSSVADALAGTPTPLGIIPLGTANVMAGELGIPVDVEAACSLIAGAHALKPIDAMEIDGKHYVTQVGVGLDAEMIRGTPDEQKRRLGRVAYLWTAARRLVGLQPRAFTLTIDGATIRPRATQVLVANCGTLGSRPFRWGEDIRPDDGKVDVCLFGARNLWHFLAVGFHFVTGQHRRSPHVNYLVARQSVTIATKHPMPVQADGEIVGQTPVTVRVIPGAVRVVVPPAKADE